MTTAMHECSPLPPYSFQQNTVENVFGQPFSTPKVGYDTGACEKRSTYQSTFHTQASITPSKICLTEHPTAEEQTSRTEDINLYSSLGDIEAIVASMTDNHHFYPPRLWSTISIGDDLLQKVGI